MNITMLWLETYLHCCSVRLGVTIMTIIKALEYGTISIVLLVMEISALEPILKLIRNNHQIEQIKIIEQFINWIDHNPSKFLITVQMNLLLCISGCFLALYGALKLKKWYLLPFIVFDGLQVAMDMIVHVLLMIAMKNHLNLGGLIGATLLGAFLILFLGYNWAAAVALFQIIQIINSKYYQALYSTLASPPLIANNLKSYGKIKHIKAPDNQMDFNKQASGVPVNNIRVYKKPQIPSSNGIHMTKDDEKDMIISHFKQYAWWQNKHHQLKMNHNAMHNNWLYGELVNNKPTSNIILTKF